MMSGHIKSGYTVGNGAAINIECGFVPRFVQVFNYTDNDIIATASLQWVIPFTSGGTTEVTAGARIKGATSEATAIVEAVLLSSGTWAGGDAAGFFVVQEGSLTGTFGTENVFIDSDETAGTNDASVTVNVGGAANIILAVATPAANTSITRLEGTAGVSGKGFTIGSALAEEAKLLFWMAFQGE